MRTITKASMPLVLAALCAVGPLGIDMYLPAIPDIARALSADEAGVQLSLMTFFVGLMLGQLVYGPLSDKFGRKPLISVGMLVFVVGALGCVFVQSIEQLQLWRLIQGLGGSIGMVLAFAIVRDSYQGPAMGKMIGLILAVLGLCPVLAPLVGSGLQMLGSWRSIFWAQVFYGIFVLGLCALALPETRHTQHREQFELKKVLSHYLAIAKDRKFLPFALSLCLVQAGFFAYIAGSATVFISHFKLSPTAFSLLFGVNALGLVFASITTAKLQQRFGHLNLYKAVVGVYVLVLAGLLAYLLNGGQSLYVLCAGLFIGVMLLGFIMPTGSELCLMQQGRNAGTASALMGAMQFGAGAGVAVISASVAHLGSEGMINVMLGCALLGYLVCLGFFPKTLMAPHHAS